MRNHNHSFLRFIIDLMLILVLFALLLSPLFAITSLKVKDLNLKAEILKSVAGAKTLN